MRSNGQTEWDVDIHLLRKYDRPGPRYTSYPTAPQFSEKVGPRQFLHHISNPADRHRHLSLYFHIPFCNTLCYFCACTMVITHNRARIAEYVDFLIREMALLSARVQGRKVRQVHWGGGTPNYLTPDEIQRLSDAIHAYYTVDSDVEMGVEIDPRDITEDHLRAFRAGGFNRISMGVQDFHEPTQKAVNRIQPETMTRRYIDLARSLGFESVNLDFIYGLPFQTPETFARTLEIVIDIRPDRIALFNYAHVPWMKKHQRVMDPQTMPAPEQKLQILKLAIERLTEAGYVFIGMDHFALPDDDLAVALREKTLYRNFQGYSTHADCDILAHGISGISQTPFMYAQNTKDFRQYYEALRQNRPATERGVILDSDDYLRREVIMRLMCDFELRFDVLDQQFEIQSRDYFRTELSELDEFIQDGLLEFDDDGIRVTRMGRLFIRNIAMTFDKYLRQSKEMRFSRTV